MALPPVISDFLDWRWMPCVALTAGSLVFVGLAVLLIPSQIDGAKPTASLSSFDRPAAPPSTTFGASLPQSPMMGEPVRRVMMAPPAPPPPMPVAERTADPPPAPETPPLPPPAQDAPAPPPDPNAPHREN
jgi:hypothetical protein